MEKGKLRIMVLDDDRFILSVLTDMLHDIGVADVVTAENGKQGLALLDAGSRMPDILMTDMCMPEMEAIEFLPLLQQKGYKGDIVFMSANYPQLLEVAEMLATHCGFRVLATLLKPVRQSDLVKALAVHAAGQPAVT